MLLKMLLKISGKNIARLPPLVPMFLLRETSTTQLQTHMEKNKQSITY